MSSEEILSYIYLNIYSIHELISNENLDKIMKLKFQIY